MRRTFALLVIMLAIGALAVDKEPKDDPKFKEFMDVRYELVLGNYM